jgi:hypothetical protein
MTPSLKRAFNMLVLAAITGERCPMDWPRGPLPRHAVSALLRLDWIRSEVSSGLFRRIIILKGEHAGKSTAWDGAPPSRINGKPVSSKPTPQKQRGPSPPRLLTKVPL